MSVVPEGHGRDTILLGSYLRLRGPKVFSKRTARRGSLRGRGPGQERERTSVLVTKTGRSFSEVSERATEVHRTRRSLLRTLKNSTPFFCVSPGPDPPQGPVRGVTVNDYPLHGNSL